MIKIYIFGSDALPSQLLLVRIIEDNKIYVYFISGKVNISLAQKGNGECIIEPNRVRDPYRGYK